jgi:hypothetical protein
VRVDAAAVGVDERDGDGLGGGGFQPGRLQHGLHPALERVGGDAVGHQ